IRFKDHILTDIVTDFLSESSSIINWHDHRNAICPGYLQIVLAKTRRNVDNARALVRRDELSTNYRKCIGRRSKVGEKRRVPETRQSGSLHAPDLLVIPQFMGVALDGRLGEHQSFAIPLHNSIVEIGIHAEGEV